MPHDPSDRARVGWFVVGVEDPVQTRGQDPMSDWRLHAACRGLNPNVFFPEGKGCSLREAREVCAGCRVKKECLEIAEPQGVWGGLSERQRRRLRVGQINWHHCEHGKCGVPFIQSRRNQKFCSDRCQGLATSQRYYQRHGKAV